MTNYNPKTWFQMIFALNKGDTLRMLWKEITYIGLFTLLISYLVLNFFPNVIVLKSLFSVYSLIGFVISLLLIFRTNTAYDRWWEGRKKWGQFLNDTRSLALKCSVLVGDENDFFRRMISNYVFSTKEFLRDGVIFDELELTEDELIFLKKKEVVPVAISHLMYDKFKELKNEGKFSEEEFIVLDKNLNKLLDGLGACERIKITPIPFSYSLFIKKFIFIYVITLPLVFASVFYYFSAFIATFIFYVLVSIEVLAEEIEKPFGKADSHLRTDDMCIYMRSNVNEILG